jgi:CRP-like cAMP-binding protein
VALKRLQATRVRLIDLYQYHREGGGQPGAADETLEAVLRRHQFLSGLPEGTVELVASCAELVPFETGNLLLSEGGVADTLYLVYRGRVAIEIHRPTQDRLIIETVEPGQVVGLSWAAPSIRWQFDARALDPVATVAIDSERLRQRLGENPAVGYALLGRLSSVVLERLQATRISLIDLYQYHREGGGHPGAASETLDAVLSRHQFLSGLPEGTLDLVASCAELVTFETGSLLLSEGGGADTLYLVHRGRVAIEIHGPTQDRVVIETVEPGQVVGLSWAAPPFRWQFDARALGRVATVAIDSERLRERLRENPAVGYALLGRLSSVVLKRLQATRVRLIDLYGVGSGH